MRNDEMHAVALLALICFDVLSTWSLDSNASRTSPSVYLEGRFEHDRAKFPDCS